MREKRKLPIIILLVLICFLAVGYAYITSNSKVGGFAKIRANTWDVHFENLKITDGSVEAKQAPVLTNTTSTEFYVVLNDKGDFYDFTLDVVNKGTIDAMIDTVVTLTLDEEEKKYLEYSLTYSDGTAINKKDLLKSGSKEKIRVHVELKKDVADSELPKNKKYISIPVDLSYIQDDNGVAVNHSKMSIEDTNSNSKADIGELITIGTEKFYVISNDGTNVKALAEWNLLVGNQYDGSSTTALTNSTGLQDSSAKGHSSSGYPDIGTVAFSSSTYWTGTDGETIDLTNSANTINPYLTAYKTSLTNLGGTISDISLITKAELIALGCNASSYSCTGAPSWVYQTSYWSSSAYISSLVWEVSNFGDIGGHISTDNSTVGVRPIITVQSGNLSYEE